MNSDEKECPFCAEVIKAKAKKCKHCGSIINATEQNLNQSINNDTVTNQFDSLDSSEKQAIQQVDTKSFRIICPDCHTQNSHKISQNSSNNNLTCPDCHTQFSTQIVIIRAKNSRGDKKNFSRTYNVRYISLEGNEDILNFVTPYSIDLELRSKDIAIFSYLNNKLSIVQNCTINKYTVLSSKPNRLLLYFSLPIMGLIPLIMGLVMLSDASYDKDALTFAYPMIILGLIPIIIGGIGIASSIKKN